MWNQRMLDFALRVGFEARLCQPYRAQTKGKVESGVKYVRRNMWPSLRFTDDADLNRQSLEWCDTGANRRGHGTTHRVPWDMLAAESPHLGRELERAPLVPYPQGGPEGCPGRLRQLGGPRYGVHWKWGGKDRSGGTEAWHRGGLGRR